MVPPTLHWPGFIDFCNALTGSFHGRSPAFSTMSASSLIASSVAPLPFTRTIAWKASWHMKSLTAFPPFTSSFGLPRLLARRGSDFNAIRESTSFLSLLAVCCATIRPRSWSEMGAMTATGASGELALDWDLCARCNASHRRNQSLCRASCAVSRSRGSFRRRPARSSRASAGRPSNNGLRPPSAGRDPVRRMCRMQPADQRSPASRSLWSSFTWRDTGSSCQVDDLYGDASPRLNAGECGSHRRWVGEDVFSCTNAANCPYEPSSPLKSCSSGERHASPREVLVLTSGSKGNGWESAVPVACTSCERCLICRHIPKSNSFSWSWYAEPEPFFLGETTYLRFSGCKFWCTMLRPCRWTMACRITLNAAAASRSQNCGSESTFSIRDGPPRKSKTR
mmetsp:Transcript_72707/g.164974  ORF Transcript_72707/g.164974 Transcript_72707/m.164974 type:complete len:395 (-) Transcript_72707:1226-2410(-)